MGEPRLSRVVCCESFGSSREQSIAVELDDGASSLHCGRDVSPLRKSC